MTEHDYDQGEVQEWIDEVEAALDLEEEFWQEDRELADMYEDLERHYEAAQEFLDNGEEANAYYEIERAYDLLESDFVVKQLNKALHIDYDDFVDRDF